MDDAAVVAVQIGRPLRSPADVVARCHLGLPVVTRVPPILSVSIGRPSSAGSGSRMAVTIRLEATGAIRALDREVLADAALGDALRSANERYAATRRELVPSGASPAPDGGVGGTGDGIKCLHAHYADHAAGNTNPVGLLAAPWVEPLNCETGCVTKGASGAVRNPAWVEPR